MVMDSGRVKTLRHAAHLGMRIMESTERYLRKEFHNPRGRARYEEDAMGWRSMKIRHDRVAEENARKLILGSRFCSSHNIVGEEFASRDQGSDFTWVLDMLDGTRLFQMGFLDWSSTISLFHEGTPVAGFVTIPMYRGSGSHIFHAVEGEGAFANGEPFRIPGWNQRSGNPLVAMARKHYRAIEFGRGAAIRDLTVGSHTTSLAYVLRRGVSAAFIRSAKLWDIAGAAFIIQTAGGSVRRRYRRAHGGWKWTERLFWFSSPLKDSQLGEYMVLAGQRGRVEGLYKRARVIKNPTIRPRRPEGRTP